MTIILGIDPGSRVTGYGVIREEKGRFYYLDSGCIRTTTDEGLSRRLMDIFEGVFFLWTSSMESEPLNSDMG